MNKRLLAGALGTVLLAGVCSQASVLATFARPVTPAASTPQDAASTYKFTEGGVQFSVPAGWEAKPDGDGAVKVTPKAGGNVQIAFVALPIPTDLNPDERAGLVEKLSGKSGVTDLKLGEYKGNETLGGMKLAVRPYEGKNNGHDVEGMFFLLSAEKLVFIALVADKSRGEALSKDAETVINSVKKIE
jgi:hypothetical protein